MADPFSFKRALTLLGFALMIVTLSFLTSYSILSQKFQRDIEEAQTSILLSERAKNDSTVLGTFLAKDGEQSGNNKSGGGGDSSSGEGSSSGSSGESSSGSSNTSSGSTSNSSNSSPGLPVQQSGENNRPSLNSGKSTSTLQQAQTGKKVENNSNENKLELENEIDNEIDNELEPVNDTKLEVNTLDNKEKVDLKKSGSSVEIENDIEGLKIKAKEADGTEVELEDKAIDEINNQLEQELGVTIEKTENNKFTIKRGKTEAESPFPLSVDLTTNVIKIKTPAGNKTLAVLPDQAVQNLINKQIIDIVKLDTQAPGKEKITLTEFNNQPAFEVKGIDKQKFLGLITVSFSKTSLVSAETGAILKIEEPLDDKILDLLSF